MFAACAAAQAQEAPTGNVVVGPPQLQDFQLKGERLTPARPAPAAETPQERPRPAQQPTEPSGARETERPAERQQEVRPRTAEPSEPAPGPRATPPGTVAAPAPLESLPLPVTIPDTVAPQPGLEPEPEQPAADPQPDEGSSLWLYALAAAALGLIAIALWRRRRSSAVSESVAEEAPVVAAPAPAPRPAPLPRPWIELEFRPERAAATATEATVQFELVVRNSGGTVARNIRIEARMFNAGKEQDKEIGAFFRKPAQEKSTSTLPSVDAGAATTLRSVVTMPRDQMRALNVQGRSLFVPMVAFNVFYEWDGGRTGQTSRSYVVGREPEQPAARMAPFRLDLGPRIYRTVGQREHSLARRI